MLPISAFFPKGKSVVAGAPKFVAWPVNYHNSQHLYREILAAMATIFSWLTALDKYSIKPFSIYAFNLIGFFSETVNLKGLLPNHATSTVQLLLGWMVAWLNDNKWQKIESESSKGSGKMMLFWWLDAWMNLCEWYFFNSYLVAISQKRLISGWRKLFIQPVNLSTLHFWS